MVDIGLEYTVRDSSGRVRYDLQTDTSGRVTLQEFLNFTKNALIFIARDTLKDEQDRGFTREPVTLVDGRIGKPVENVNPLGKIEYVAPQQLSTIALELYQAISERSPVDTGLYKSQNLVFFNGKQIASNIVELEAWFATAPAFEDRDRLRFVNAAPYAQRLERYGVTRQRSRRATRKSRDKKLRSGQRVLKPNGVYALSFRSIRRKYKGNAFFKFELLPGDYLGITQPLPTTAKQKYRATFDPKGKFNSGYYIYPSILIGVQQGGTL